jgi:hypothetical protein
MHNKFLFFMGWFFLFNIASTLIAQEDYSNHKQLSERLDKIASAYPALVAKESLTKTYGGKDIWLVTVGSGAVSDRPAIAILGGISGDLILGTELATQFIENLLAIASSDRITNALLDSITFYVFPDMSPDAREQYFAPIQYERFGNAKPADLDRDGRIGEDPYDDLNNDGMITLMRIKDPTGNWMKHPDDDRIMVKAQTEKGERGNYLVFREGIDNDKDGEFNEDGEEGVFFNKNFSFKYPAFTRGAGEHPISEIESRAIADFLFEAKNVFAVICFGPANNLSEPLRYSERDASGRIPTGWLEKDIKVNQMVSLTYNQHMKDQKRPGDVDNNGLESQEGQDTDIAPGVDETASLPSDDRPLSERLDMSNGKGIPGTDGDFFQWAYFHYGRFSFSTPGWWVPATANEASGSRGSRDGNRTGNHASNPELEFLRWAETENINDVFVPWTPVNHPDFPGKETDVGGLKPFVMKNPPYELTETLATKHTEFILSLASLRPVTDIINVKTESLGNNLFRITADVINRGSFPTVSELGQRNRWVQKTVVRVNPSGNQQLISGKLIEVIDVIDGHSSLQRSWLVRGKGNLIIRSGAESTGFSEVTISL